MVDRGEDTRNDWPSFLLLINFALFYLILASLITILQNMDASYLGVKVILQLLNPEFELTDQFQCSGTNFTTRDPQQLTATIPPLGRQGSPAKCQ